MTRSIAPRGTWSLVGLVALAFPLFASPASAWSIRNRWTNTLTDGGGHDRGDPLTLLWSVVPDGESWPRDVNSDLIDALDVGWGISSANRTPDLNNRSWWTQMNRVYEQYTRVSGLTMVYAAEQNPDGSDTGNEGDIRIGGVPFIWENDKGGVLADNAFPNGGDMRIDTYRGSNGIPPGALTSGNSFRNLIAHETGHGVGLNHDESSDRSMLMEPTLQTGFFALQFDTIYAINRSYGDPLEKNGGNDTDATATDLGNLSDVGSIRLGEDAANFDAAEMEDQWVGIDGTSDEDWFRVSTTSTSIVDITITPLGPSYNSSNRGNVDTSRMADLNFSVYLGSESSGVQEFVDLADAGTAESLVDFIKPAGEDLLIEIDSEEDQNQFYQIDVNVWDIGVASDLDNDGDLDISDWVTFKANQGVDFVRTTEEEAAAMGDIDGDFDNDAADFYYFKTAYIGVHGAEAFEALLAVPEPTALGLALFAAAGAVVRRRGAVC